MEHIIQFGITIDDDKIEKTVLSRASEALTNEIKKRTESFCNSRWNDDSELKIMFKEEVKTLVYDNKDLILEQVVKQVANGIQKSKEFVQAKSKLVDKFSEE